MESNTWCPRLTAWIILSGSAVHVKGFGSAVCSTTKRLIAACKSTTDRKTPRFNHLQPARVRDFQPAVLRLPFVKGCAADAVLAADISRLRASLLLSQDRNDLLFLEP
jgi:hypothetical protein